MRARNLFSAMQAAEQTLMHVLKLLTIPPLQPLHYVALSSEPAAVEAAKALLEVGMQLPGCAPLLLVV